jgi:hypothetical protein
LRAVPRPAAASLHHAEIAMKALLAAVTLALAALSFSAAALAQGCTGACAREHARCHKHFATLGSECRRSCGRSQSCGSACQKREDAYAAECSRQNQACRRACGGR